MHESVAFQHVLVATDFGTSSVRATHVAAELASRLTARLTVLHVIPEAPPVYPIESPRAPDSREDRERGAKRELDAFLGQLPNGRESNGVIRFGDAAREIVAEAEETDCDIVVVGTHGRGRIARLLLGSTADKVVRTSHVPVLTVREEDTSATSATP